jgi:hypothetical protein
MRFVRRAQATSSGLQLINGDFEQGFQAPEVLQAPYERLFGTASSGAEYVLSSRVNGWQTTASTRVIEIWSGGYSGVKSVSGKAHAELNADQVSALYQVRTERASQHYVTSSGSSRHEQAGPRIRLTHCAMQDIDTVPGMLLYWCAAHAHRVCLRAADGIDGGRLAGLCRIAGAPARTSWSCASARPRRRCCSAASRTATLRGAATTARTPSPPASG